MFTVTKKFEFEASHKLDLTYESPCQNLHGHSYKVEITISSDKLDENGMVIDFSKLNIIKDWVMQNWDHTTLVPFKDGEELMVDVSKFCGKIYNFQYPNVTAEYMCLVLHEKAVSLLNISPYNVTIKINETSNNFATYTRSSVNINAVLR